MGQTIIKLGEGADLIIEEPNGLALGDRALILTQAIVQEFRSEDVLAPSSRRGSLAIRVGSMVYQVYYQLRVRRTLKALTAYSEAIRHIEDNLYDWRLARQAIGVLRQAYRGELK